MHQTAMKGPHFIIPKGKEQQPSTSCRNNVKQQSNDIGYQRICSILNNVPVCLHEGQYVTQSTGLCVPHRSCYNFLTLIISRLYPHRLKDGTSATVGRRFAVLNSSIIFIWIFYSLENIRYCKSIYKRETGGFI